MGTATQAKKQVILQQIQAIVGADWVTDAADDLRRYGRDWLVDFAPAPCLVVRPRTVAEIAAIVALCREQQLSIVPSGGRTGLSGAATATNGELVLSLERMNTIQTPDPVGRTVVCEAGVVTEKLQTVAREHGLYFPVDFASKGSSQIGGNIATNAGGIRVLRYGNFRDWVVGLTVVTGTGEILELGGALLKNQTGYDLRGLVIGSEGTLAIVAGATLQLTDDPGEYTRALIGLESLEAVRDFYVAVRQKYPSLSAFEYLDAASYALVLRHHPQSNPLGENPHHVVLVEFEHSDNELRDAFTSFLADTLTAGGITSGVVSASSVQAATFLRIRELVSATISDNFRVHKNDISVPVASGPEFISQLQVLREKFFGEFQLLVFGHIGDGNLHLNLLKPASMSGDQFVARWQEIDQLVFGLVQRFKGSISAEHGVGLLKKSALHFSRTPAELVLMREIKKCWDPQGILNPGKIFAL